MWGSKQPEVKPLPSAEPAAPQKTVPATPPMPPARVETARLTQAIMVTGEITGREDLYVDGEMHGTIRMPESRVTIGPNGRVTADIEAAEIVIEGCVEGKLLASTRIELRRTAVVTGDMVAERLAIEEGGQIRGRVEMVRPGESRAPRAAAATAGAVHSAD